MLAHMGVYRRLHDRLRMDLTTQRPHVSQVVDNFTQVRALVLRPNFLVLRNPNNFRFSLRPRGRQRYMHQRLYLRGA